MTGQVLHEEAQLLALSLNLLTTSSKTLYRSIMGLYTTSESLAGSATRLKPDTLAVISSKLVVFLQRAEETTIVDNDATTACTSYRIWP